MDDLGRGLKRTLKRIPVVGERLTPVRYALRHPQEMRHQRGNGGAFLLNTMRKSGSVYLMSIIGNYLWFRFLGETTRLDYPALRTHIWNQLPDNPTVERIRIATGYRAWKWEHDNPLIRFNDARTIVHTYRNPLDNFVSRYNWYYVNRDNAGSPRHGATRQSTLESEVAAFAWHYVSVREIAQRPNVLRIAYEHLVRDPLEVAAGVVRACFPVTTFDESALETAVQASARDQVVADEKRYGLDGGNLVGAASVSFIRSGAVGEWRTVLSEVEVRRVEAILAEHRISLDEFVLD